MASKQKKSIKAVSSPARKPTVKDANPAFTWMLPVLYGVFGGFAFYFLHPILNFKPADAGKLETAMTAISFMAAFFGATRFFQQHNHTIAIWTIPLVGLQVLVNLALTYGWVGQETVWMVLASMLTIPIGIIWFFILKATAEESNVPSENHLFPIREVFAPPSTKIAGIVILLVAGILCFYKLGYYNLWEDENLVINAAKGFYENGFSYFKEGYDRAWLHTIICSGFFEVFGISEFSGRLPSAIFGIGFVLISFYVFARWYGLAWLALLIPLVCLMNDKFLILFRYMRMYALLIPLFLGAAYVIYNTVLQFNSRTIAQKSGTRLTRTQIGYTIFAILLLPILAHIHKLSMVILPVVGFFILYLVLLYRTRNHWRLLLFVISIGLILLFLTFVVQMDALRMFKQVANRILKPHTPITAYFEYVFENGLPRNSTIMILLAGLGLLGSGLMQRVKHLLIFNYLLLVFALISMVYLIQDEGRDYRYIAHIVPFVVCNLLVITFYIGRVFSRKTYPWTLIGIFLLSTLFFITDYTRVYVKHPWSPRYSEAYPDIKNKYNQGEAIFFQNMKTYYLDPRSLAGEHALKLGRRKEYSLEQFKTALQPYPAAWVVFDTHKAYHIEPAIIQYLQKRFQKIHGSGIDDTGVEVYYFARQ